MGMEKRDHIAALAAIERVAESWRAGHGRAITDADIDELYHAFVPLLAKTLREYSAVIDGVAEAVDLLRERGVKIGASTGYFQQAADIVAESAAEQGYVPDASISASAVTAGRPAPWMIYRLMECLQVYPLRRVVNVGDTVVDMETSANAGVWAVGISRTGNLCGLSEAEFARLNDEDGAKLVTVARRELRAAGAHYVVDSVAELPPVIDAISDRLRRGESP
jgi:phosphonoacetaldehyde hydrolase